MLQDCQSKSDVVNMVWGLVPIRIMLPANNIIRLYCYVWENKDMKISDFSYKKCVFDEKEKKSWL